MGNTPSYSIRLVVLRKWALVTPYVAFVCTTPKLDGFVFGDAEQYDAINAFMIRGYDPNEARRISDHKRIALDAVKARTDVRSADYIEILNESKKILVRIELASKDGRAVDNKAEYRVMQVCLSVK